MVLEGREKDRRVAALEPRLQCLAAARHRREGGAQAVDEGLVLGLDPVLGLFHLRFQLLILILTAGGMKRIW